ncbi:hypothetical protein [Papillibacter cinnamivorans]|uniref:Uncharacterized protein n=1 Tax=Papillibacter cinnamivorans DSM 12816 TaxID=1122930 RepID=A0A1W1YQQ3_9FIRM|nr:hypothetical protein [Papillibacter cinnamivorans]SMC38507.1 hypothetical protein SAMN02745168_0633 [Papillibacter cinnamivorans DSM 12816]
MKGTNIAEQFHVVNILPPQDVDTGKTADIFSMKNYAHATIIVQCGSTNADAGNITIEECDNFTPTTDTAIDFYYYAETTAAGDTLGARTKAEAATGIDVSANDNTTYVIEIDASQLSDGYPCIELKWSDPGGATYASAVAILSGPRYAEDQSPTAIA